VVEPLAPGLTAEVEVVGEPRPAVLASPLLPGRALAVPDWKTQRAAGALTIYADDSRPNRFYYAPAEIAVVTTSDGKPDFHFLETRYTGSAVGRDRGTILHKSLVTFTVRLPHPPAEELTRVARELGGAGAPADLLHQFRVCGQGGVRGKERRGFFNRLSDEKTIERIAMQQRQLSDAACRADVGRELGQAGPERGSGDFSRLNAEVGSAQRRLDRDFPDAHGAEEHLVFLALDRTESRAVESPPVTQSPQE